MMQGQTTLVARRRPSKMNKAIERASHPLRLLITRIHRKSMNLRSASSREHMER